MKAVIWTDVLQTIVILVGLLATIIQGLITPSTVSNEHFPLHPKVGELSMISKELIRFNVDRFL
jgi:Na+/proline symporter